MLTISSVSLWPSGVLPHHGPQGARGHLQPTVQAPCTHRAVGATITALLFQGPVRLISEEHRRPTISPAETRQHKFAIRG